METLLLAPKVRLSPRDFFLELGSFVGLYFIVVNFLILVFHIIDRAFPDALSNSQSQELFWTGPIRWSIASLVIAYPLLIVLTRVLRRDWQVNPEKRNLSLRRWLIYLTVFVTGVTLAVDAIVLLNSFL